MADMKTTLCWWCENAVPGAHTGCSWSRELQPVDGWRATQRNLMFTIDASTGKTKELISYIVHWCPEYRREKRAVN